MNQLIDKINLNILKALSENARMSYSDIGRRVHLSAPAVTERVKKLEQEGVIVGYKPEINLEKIGIPITALIECEVHRTKEREFKALLLQQDEIIKIYNITGPTTFIVKVGVTSMSELDKLIELMIDYCDTNTKFVMCMPYDDVMPQRIEKLIE